MAMSIILRKENGTEIDRSDLGIPSSLLDSLAKQVPMLSWLDAYEMTIYNSRQRERLVEEIRVADPNDETRVVLWEIRRLCALAKPHHQYLWFIGD